MLVVDGHANVNFADKRGHTPLHLAVFRGNLDLARMLVVDGHANVDVTNERARTALHVATHMGHLDIARMLVVDGQASVDITDKDGLTPLHEAAYHDHLDVARVLVVDGHANVDAKDIQGYTLLYWAARFGHNDLAHFLLDKGARPDVANEKGVTPIDVAALPCNHVKEVIGPDMGLLCRMMRESGALIVLASKMVAAHLERTEKQRQGDADAVSTVGSLVAKVLCVGARHAPNASDA